MLPYLIAGVIGYGISKLFDDKKAPKYTDGGLIAPNGKPSNLTPEQYKLVRTKAFKEWFGFWDLYAYGKAKNYYEPSVKKIAKELKEEKLSAINEAVNFLSKQVTENDVLIPMPSRYGIATDTRKLAQKISEKTGAKLFDCLVGKKRKSVYEMKKNNQDLSNFDFNFQINCEIPKAKNYFIVDNVIGTGVTMKNALQNVIKNVGTNVSPLVFAIDLNNISKVVDSNGEPLVVYHGSKSNEEFNVFKQSSRFEFIYFAKTKEYAWFHFTKGIIDKPFQLRPFFLNIRNLLNGEEYGFEKVDFSELKSFFYGIHELSKDIQLNPKSQYRFWEVLRFSNDIYDSLKNQDYYDGISFYENFYDNTTWNDTDDYSLSYVVMNPNQIKLADGTNTTFDGSNPDIRFMAGGQATINEEAQQYIDIISMNPKLEKYQKYKVILKDKFGIDFDSIYKDQEYIDNANLNDIKKQDDFLDFGNWLDYAKIISKKRGFVPMDLYDTPYKLTDEIWNETSKNLDFIIKKIPYTERGIGSGYVARAFGDTIYYTDHADFYYFLHELGHIYDFKNNIKGIIKNPAYSPTNYGTTNSGETFAENFAIFFINPMALKNWNEDVYNAMDSEINEKYKNEINRIIHNYLF